MDNVNEPSHYQGEGMQCIDVVEAFNLGFNLGNSLKYILRAGKKGDVEEDLMKAVWYLQREMSKIECGDIRQKGSVQDYHHDWLVELMESKGVDPVKGFAQLADKRLKTILQSHAKLKKILDHRMSDYLHDREEVSPFDEIVKVMRILIPVENEDIQPLNMQRVSDGCAKSM